MRDFIDASVEDLVVSTMFIHSIKPSLVDKYVCKIEKNQPNDKNVVFHLMLRDKTLTGQEAQILILSSDYILEHPFWKANKNDGSN